MRVPRVSFAAWAFWVALIAGDLSWLRKLFAPNGSSAFGFPDWGYDIGVIPMANLVTIGLAALMSRRGVPARFLTGFVGSGSLSIAAYMTWAWLDPSGMSRFFESPLNFLWSLSGSGALTSWPAYIILVAVLGAPQVVFAVIGGWLFSRGGVSTVLRAEGDER